MLALSRSSWQADRVEMLKARSAMVVPSKPARAVTLPSPWALRDAGSSLFKNQSK